MIAPCIRSTSVKNAAVLLFALLVPVWNLAFCAQNPNSSPLLAELWLERGNTLLQQGNDEEALQVYERILRMQPDHARAWHNKAFALWQLDRKEEALFAYDQALKLRPDNAHTWRFKGALLNTLDRPQEALDAFEQSLKIQPDNAFALVGKCCALKALGREQEAKDASAQAEQNQESCINIKKGQSQFQQQAPKRATTPQNTQKSAED